MTESISLDPAYVQVPAYVPFIANQLTEQCFKERCRYFRIHAPVWRAPDLAISRFLLLWCVARDFGASLR
jgi:hypothetical protein